MTSLYEQQKAHREWLHEAGGDLRLVERAIIDVTERARAEGRHATSAEVLHAIRKKQRSASAGTREYAHA